MRTPNLKAILIDDDVVSLTILENFCRKSGTVDLAGRFSQPEQALEFLSENIIDVVFLDVEMPGLNGFELLDRLTYLPKIVLTTSKTDYAFTAFQYEVADYLKKPVSYDRFLRTVNRLSQPQMPATAPPMDEKQDIFIRSDGKLVRLSIDDILFVECIGDYVKYVTMDKKIVSHATMKSVNEKLDPAVFLKVHRSYIVNTRKIKDIQDNTLIINGQVIPISRAHKGEVMQRLNIL